ncbi:hypothetical protein [Mycolicibacterium neworleansense]|uniref:Uncharacterized protein n=1 Tax=Mycolicibacterium neworleansense TaxID=146018 RepID=A0A0H5RMY1_9MYCO|nr:hypothetical protein [Mycolicibacterium neworleansense]MCV7363852.1 hypothetical protein [Mycolicibacterium neworleansense]CRZ14807.1 hypothetical protein BN2156_01663 [Mycolicibacterium neworleansense]
MASVADIERLKALTDRLLPLSSRARGEVIAAADWNTVVGALLEVARAVVADGTETAVPAHDHPDQVTLGWLDPRLRTLIEGGPLSDPVAAARVTSIERQAALVSGRLDEVNREVRDLRTVTSRQETNDLDRASALTVLSRTVSGMKDPRNEIAALRSSLDAIGATVSAVSSFATGLGDITPAALLDGLNQVDQLRQRLTTPTGSLLDAAEFERRLTELQTTLVTEQELTDAIKSRPARLTAAVKAELLEETRVTAQRQAEDSARTLTEAMQVQLGTRIDEVTQSAVQAARSAAADFRGELQATITTDLTELIRQGQTASDATLTERVDAAASALRSAVDQRITELQGSLDDRVSAAITAARPELLAAFTATVDDRIRGLTQQLSTFQVGLDEIQVGLNATNTELAAVQQRTNATLDSRDAALRAEMATERRRVDGQLADMQRQIPPRSTGITREEMLLELNRNNDQLRSEMTRLTTRVDPGQGVVLGPIIRPPR